MAVYHFTLHTYRSWNADHPRGWVKRDCGIQLPDPERAQLYNRHALHPPALFTAEHKDVVFWIVADACLRRQWRLHALAAEPTHVHILVSWQDYLAWEKVRGKLKNLMSLELGVHFQKPGHHWFGDKGSRKQIRERKHFDYLMDVYFPKHQWHWREREPQPAKPKPWTSVRG
jgi:REP element-mobilizing transposase RayT